MLCLETIVTGPERGVYTKHCSSSLHLYVLQSASLSFSTIIINNSVAAFVIIEILFCCVVWSYHYEFSRLFYRTLSSGHSVFIQKSCVVLTFSPPLERCGWTPKVYTLMSQIIKPWPSGINVLTLLNVSTWQPRDAFLFSRSGFI